MAGAAIGGLALGAIVASAASQGNCQIAIYDANGDFVGYRQGVC
jgi:hypothetical protein